MKLQVLSKLILKLPRPKKRFAAAAIGAAVVFCAALIAIITAKHGLEAPAPNERLVSAFTGGTIGTADSIYVVFVDVHDATRVPGGSAFDIMPRTRGTWRWKDDWTLVFSPDKSWQPETHYEVLMRPAKFISIEKSDKEDSDELLLSPFKFEFSTRGPKFELSVEPAYLNDDKKAVFRGRIITEDEAADAEVEKVLRSSSVKTASWRHDGAKHFFEFEPIARGRAEKNFLVRYDAKSLGSKRTGELNMPIPPLAHFEVSEILLPENSTIRINFSSPLKDDVDLRGFIEMAGTKLTYKIDGNNVDVFSASPFKAGSVLEIRDLTDRYGELLAQAVTYTVSDKWEMPEARFTGAGVILPTSQGTAMAADTRNLSGIIIEAFEIYGGNIAQFLQVNDLDGSSELIRVGAPIWSKAFEFDWKQSDKNRWVRRGLDLSELARTHPDSMFFIRMTFRKRHVHYECAAHHSDFSTLDFPSDALPAISGAGESSYWDGAEDDWHDGWYQWKSDPCHPAFYSQSYNSKIVAAKNVLVSDLALMAKRAESGEYLIAAANLRTAEGTAGAEIEFLTYQGRRLHSARTGADGTVQVRLPSGAPPAFLFARGGGHRAFIKLSDSLSLATSHFDVSGERAASGIKGFIYGERGVWRPGDNIYLTFLLAGTKQTLPENHPINFELEDPEGRITVTRTLAGGIDGFYPITVATKESAPTGDWTARVRVGGAVFYKKVKVETIMPNRLKMNLEFKSGGKPVLELDAQKTQGALVAQWLHGAPAPNLKTDISVTFADTGTKFSTNTDYSFRDSSRILRSERQTVFEGKLDGKGSADFSIELNPGRNVPGKLSARLLTRVFEPSGAFSSEQTVMDFSPYSRYVGLKLPSGDTRGMLLTDTVHKADIVLLDAAGKSIKEEVELDAAIYKMSWRWWWEKGGDEEADWEEALSHTPIKKEKIKISGGRGQWSFNIKQPDWGRYLVLVEDKNSKGGHAASQVCYIDWPGWAGRSQGGAGGAALSLALTASKQNYNSGEAVSISFPSNSSANALVVLEKGGEILKKEWIRCSDGTTTYTFNADSAMPPNIYAHITLVQPHLQTANDRPIRLYGIVPILIQDTNTVLKPEIRTTKVWEPGSKASFTVRESLGRAMTYTAVVVDEGLLGLTRFALPDPHKVFYSKEASFLKSWDVFSEVMSAYSGKLETLLAIGGGDEGIEGGTKPKRFEPVVKYFEPRRLAAGASDTITFDMPEYTGAVRIMVVAASGAKIAAFGAAEESVQVKSDLMILASAPRTLASGDEAAIPVTVFSYKEGKRAVKVSITTSGAVSTVKETSANVDFDAAGDKTITFLTRAGNAGISKITVRAESAGLKTAVSTINLSVNDVAMPVSVTKSMILAAGESWNESIDLPGREGTNTAVLELSHLPPLNLETRLSYLIAYPHGCIEQTTSAVFPQIYLEHFTGLSPEKIAATRENIAAGIERIAGFATFSGGFSYWQGSGEADEWGTSYAGHFLISARDAGFAVDDALLNKWADFQRKKAAGWSSQAKETDIRTQTMNQAYRLYTLARAGKPELGAMNRLRDKANLPPQAAWRLAAAYWYAGQRDAARVMTASLSQAVDAYRELDGTYGSGLRDKAMILESLAIMNRLDNAQGLLRDVTSALSTSDWLSTQEAAYALIAIMPFADSGGAIEAEWNAGNGTARTLSSMLPSFRTDPAPLSGTKSNLNIKNTSSSKIYAHLTVKGTPNAGDEKPLSNGLSLEVKYYFEGKEINISKIPQGEDIEIRAQVANKTQSDVKNIALVQSLPASFEIINTRIGGAKEKNYDDDDDDERQKPKRNVTYQDIRDDKVLSYFDLPRGSQKIISFTVNNSYTGTFRFPASQVYAMYDESINAVVPGSKK